MPEFHVDCRYGSDFCVVKSRHGWRYSVQKHEGQWIIWNQSGWQVLGPRAVEIFETAFGH